MCLGDITAFVLRSSTPPLIFEGGAGGGGVGGSVRQAELFAVAYAILLATPAERHTIQFADGRVVI